MTGREAELRSIWQKERPMYEAWGRFVCAHVKSLIVDEIDPSSIELFFRIPLKHRTKEEASLLAKAFHRNKPYKDPYSEIEDKVGVRIVVLFSDEIRLVERLINSCQLWTSEKSRDYEDEQAQKPFEFDYQSLHYIIRASEDIEFDGEIIVKNSPCEIQIRTILQHAYSELTHDTIYKPSVQAEPDVKRAAAKSMALIEATNDYFTQVKEKIYRAQEAGLIIANLADRLYKELVKIEHDNSPLNSIIVDHYKQFLTSNAEIELNEFYQGKPYLIDTIAERAPGFLLYRQSAVLLIYYTISMSPRDARINSPLSDSELEPLYSDLGIRMP